MAQEMRRKLLTKILGVRGRVDALRGLLRLPEAYSGSARSISRMAGLDHRVGQRALDDLVTAGLVRVRVTPAANLYSLNTAHPLYRPLKAAFEAEARYTDDIRRAVARGFQDHQLSVRNAYLYGSFARGEDDARSDIDVAVVVDPSQEERVRAALEELAEELRARFGTDFHFVVASRPLVEMARSEERDGALWPQVAAEAIELV
jgi:predicted nucleotidyltransferase